MIASALKQQKTAVAITKKQEEFTITEITPNMVYTSWTKQSSKYYTTANSPNTNGMKREVLYFAAQTNNSISTTQKASVYYVQVTQSGFCEPTTNLEKNTKLNCCPCEFRTQYQLHYRPMKKNFKKTVLLVKCYSINA